MGTKRKIRDLVEVFDGQPGRVGSLQWCAVGRIVESWQFGGPSPRQKGHTQKKSSILLCEEGQESNTVMCGVFLDKTESTERKAKWRKVSSLAGWKGSVSKLVQSRWEGNRG